MKCKVCSRCKLSKSTTEFYNRTGEVLQSYCKACFSSVTHEAQKSKKIKSIQYKGGMCEICGYNRNTSALEFHHKDPSIKDGMISKLQKRIGFEKLTIELDKCMLVCANCHREIHYPQSNT